MLEATGTRDHGVVPVEGSKGSGLFTSGFWTSIRGSHIRSHIRRLEDAEFAPRSLADHLTSPARMRILAFKIVHWAEPCREGANAYSYGLTTECLTVTQSTVIGLAGLANLPHELVLRAANWIKLALLANGRETPYLRLETLGRCRPGGSVKPSPGASVRSRFSLFPVF
jgi:hypothetical protein